MKKILIMIFVFFLFSGCGENSVRFYDKTDNDQTATINDNNSTNETDDYQESETSDHDEIAEYECLHHCWDNPYTITTNRFTESGEGVETILTDSHTDLQWTRTIDHKNWQDAIDQCENLTYSGYSDWELPDIYEAASYGYKFGQPSPGFLINYIGGWSSTTFNYDEKKAFTSTTSLAEKSESRGFNCVRGKTSEYVEENNRFTKEIVDGQEIIYDNKTALKWKFGKCSDEDWNNGWRSPDYDQLGTLINWNRYNPSTDFPEIESAVYDTPQVSDGNEDGSGIHQIVVDFTDGRIFDTYGEKVDNIKYLCVFYEEN